MGSITAVNAIFQLSIPLLFPIPQQLQGFSADDIFSTDAIETVETLMGVDGILSAGFVFVGIKQSITLQADSASNFFFDQWRQAMLAAKDVFFANGVVVLKSINTKWSLTQGILTTYPPIPDAGKTLRPRRFGVMWQQVGPAVV